MNLAENLIQKKVMICFNTTERAHGLKKFLEGYGFEVAVFTKVKDLLENLPDFFPHLIVTAATLKDGSVAEIYDATRDRANNFKGVFRHVPIFANLSSKAKDQILPCKGRDLAGLLVGSFEPKTFLVTYLKFIREQESPSPYYIDLSQQKNATSGHAEFPIRKVGFENSFLAFSSTTVLGNNSTISIQDKNKISSVERSLRLPSAVEGENLYFFSASKASGDLIANAKSECFDKVKRDSDPVLIVTHCGKSYFESLANFFNGYGVSAVFAQNCEEAWNIYDLEGGEDGGVSFLFFDFFNDSLSKVFQEKVEKIPLQRRPISIFVDAKNLPSRWEPTIRLNFPIGLESLVTAVESSFIDVSHWQLKASLSAGEATGLIDLDVCGLDERGLIVHSSAFVQVDEVLNVSAPIVDEHYEQKNSLRVKAVVQSGVTKNYWLLHLVTEDSQDSLFSFYLGLSKKMKSAA